MRWPGTKDGPLRYFISEAGGAWYVTSYGFAGYCMAGIGQANREQRAL